MSKYVYIDFEYNNAREYFPELVSVSWQIGARNPIHSLWLYKSQKNKESMQDILLRMDEEGYTFVSYAVTAEARCFDALGIDPTEVRWVDLYLEWRQIRNCNDTYNYGRYFINNMRMESVAPHMNPRMNQGKNNYQLRFGLTDCCARLLDVNANKDLKYHMRDLILSAPDQFKKAEQADIMEYCEGDIKYLRAIHVQMTEILEKELRATKANVVKWQLKRGEFSAHAALMESEGIPLDMDAVQNLRKNVELAKDKLITSLVENHYPFFERKKKRKSELLGSWVDRYDNFKAFLEGCDAVDIRSWKMTDSGRYCADDEYLKKFEGIPELKEYRETRKILGQLKWLRQPKEGEDDFLDHIGSDGRLRTFFGIYGTQTARNAPMAKRFIFAMSAWLRCLIRPPEGYVVTEIDYASQEFAIAAILSKDVTVTVDGEEVTNGHMTEAYESGDPYLYFAKKAGAVPKDGTKQQYKKERDLFKATTLGLQYGMGAKSLAIKLTSDMGKRVSEARAEKLINLHKRVYPTYWRWLKKLDGRYQRKGFLQLPCGWALLGDNPHTLSVRNFPTQGVGSTIIREAVRSLKASGIQTIATLHDAVYIISPEEELDQDITVASKCMIKAFNDVLKNPPLAIRLDVSSHKADTPWISEKGARFYDILKEYLGPKETRADIIEKLMLTIYK